MDELLRHVRKYTSIWRAILIIVSLLPLYYGSYEYRLRYSYGLTTPSTSKAPPPIDFVREWLGVELIDPFNAYPMAMYCNRTEWHPNLVFKLADAVGGFANIRSNFLDFLFFAIEAGASIVLPRMAARSEDNLSDLWAGTAPFDKFFDEETFYRHMGLACPQMAIYKQESEHTLAAPLSGMYTPAQRRPDFDSGNTKQAYLNSLDSWLKNNKDFKPEELTLVNIERTLWEIDTRSLPRGFRRNFGQVLKIDPAIRRFAALVVKSLASKYHIRIDPTDVIPRKAFYGAHLRTEADVKQTGWLDNRFTNFTAQTDTYMSESLKHQLNVIYVACGDATDLEQFRKKAAAHQPPFNVTSKLDLLPANEAAAMQELTWDQQALVDFEVLQRASAFGGLVHSSFSYNIAMRRNQWLEDQGRVLDPWFVKHKEEGVEFDDGLSRIVGKFEIHEKKIPRGMFP